MRAEGNPRELLKHSDDSLTCGSFSREPGGAISASAKSGAVPLKRPSTFEWVFLYEQAIGTGPRFVHD